MRRIIAVLLIALLFSACAAPAGQSSEEPPPKDQDIEEETPETDETEDLVLLTLEAPLSDGRTLTLEAFGRVLDEYTCGVREVRVYDGEELLQTVLAEEAIRTIWGDGNLLPGEEVSEYTSCWKPEGSMEAMDLNFDGNTDFGLFGWITNNTIPYYYWIWDTEAEQYRYAFLMQGLETHPETGEVSAVYRIAAGKYVTDYFKPDETGSLYLERVELLNWEESDSKDRAALEIWLPNADQRIPAGASGWTYDQLLLVRRERPVREVHADNTVSYCTEIWELKNGKFQMTSREEFFYENQP